MGNKSTRQSTVHERTARQPQDIIIPVSRDGTVKSILRKNVSNYDNDKEKSSISSTSSTSSIAKQSVTFSDDLQPDMDTLTGNYEYAIIKKAPPRQSIGTIADQYPSTLSSSTETLKREDQTYLRPQHSITKVKIAYASDFKPSRGSNHYEPFNTDCVLLPSYTSTVTSHTLRQRYGSYDDFSNNFNSKSLAERKEDSRKYVTQIDYSSRNQGRDRFSISDPNSLRFSTHYNGSMFCLDSSKYDNG